MTSQQVNALTDLLSSNLKIDTSKNQSSDQKSENTDQHGNLDKSLQKKANWIEKFADYCFRCNEYNISSDSDDDSSGTENGNNTITISAGDSCYFYFSTAQDVLNFMTKTKNSYISEIYDEMKNIIVTAHLKHNQNLLNQHEFKCPDKYCSDVVRCSEHSHLDEDEDTEFCGVDNCGESCFCLYNDYRMKGCNRKIIIHAPEPGDTLEEFTLKDLRNLFIDVSDPATFTLDSTEPIYEIEFY